MKNPFKGPAVKEAAQYRGIREARNIGINPFDGKFSVVDVDRIVSVGHDGMSRITPYRLERLVYRRGNDRSHCDRPAG